MGLLVWTPAHAVDLARFAFLSLKPTLRGPLLDHLVPADRQLLEQGWVDRVPPVVDPPTARAEINDCCGFQVFIPDTPYGDMLYGADAAQFGWSDDDYAIAAAYIVAHVL